MPLTMILGPMKSGKSFDLISEIAPLKYTNLPHVLYQSDRHVRDEARVKSRGGADLEAVLVSSVEDAVGKGYIVVGIDELHMFPESDAAVIADLLKRHVRVVASGLDTDHQGRMFPIVQKLLALGPHEVRYRKAVCEDCRRPDAVFTQVSFEGKPVSGELPSVLPEDGTYTYKAVCRHCFVTGEREV